MKFETVWSHVLRARGEGWQMSERKTPQELIEMEQRDDPDRYAFGWQPQKDAVAAKRVIGRLQDQLAERDRELEGMRQGAVVRSYVARMVKDRDETIARLKEEHGRVSRENDEYKRMMEAAISAWMAAADAYIARARKAGA